MDMVRLRCIASALVALPLSACAHYQRYSPAPLAPAQETARYAARRLDDTALARFLAAHGAQALDSSWDSRQLSLAALYFRADLAQARGALEVARAGEITAGERPYPSVSATTERAARPDEGNSTPWTFSLTAGLALELGGKRAARVEHARAVTLASRLRLEWTAWQIAQSAHLAAATAIAAEADLADARAETEALRELVQLLHGRYAEGQISRGEVARAESDAQTSAVAATQAARSRMEARLELAHALAVPLGSVDTLPLAPDPQPACATDSLTLDSLETMALRARADVGAALADYAAAEADLRLQVAQQYPDIVVGPGIAWEQGVRRWILSLALPSIATDRARGPIAEATAKRAVQAARVTLVQDEALAAVDSSAAACVTARRDVLVADSLVNITREQLRIADLAYQRGETGQTEVAFARLALVRAERVADQARHRIATAGAALESSTGVWLSGLPLQWSDILVPADTAGHAPEHHQE